jgi:hypothetical protein
LKKLIEAYEKDCDSVKKNAMQLSWYTRGGISYTDVLNLSSKEREMLNEMIESNLETTKKANLPFF